MFDSIQEILEAYPYIGVALIFVLCGLGLPLPEELVLIAGGYVCAKLPETAQLHWMMLWCAGGILAGDLLPYVLGRVFGARILRLRWLRMTVTRKRLAKFDRWFRRRGDLVIFIARFLAGIRSIAFFTAGMMKMRWRRFLLLDGLGIALIVPLMVWLGHRGAGVIDHVILQVQAVERGILILALIALLLTALWYWLYRRRRRRLTEKAPSETFVEPQLPVRSEALEDDATGPATVGATAEAATGSTVGPGTATPDAATRRVASPTPPQRPDAGEPADPPASQPPPPPTPTTPTTPTGPEPSAPADDAAAAPERGDDAERTATDRPDAGPDRRG